MKPTLGNESSLDRQEQQREARERQRQNIPKLFKVGAKPACPAPQAAPAAPTPVEASPPVHAGAVEPGRPRAASIGFHLYRDFDSAPIKVSTTIEQLAGQLLSIPPGKVEVAVLWPGSLRSLACAHAVATISRWHTGDKRGVRTLVYPARANIFQDLNRALIDRIALAKLFAELFEPGRGEPPNPRVTVECQEKDSFFTSLRSVRSNDGAELQPAIGEVLPHYFADQNFVAWKSCAGDLLKNLKTRLGDTHRTKALNTGAIAQLSEPGYAPDALFALGWRTSTEDIERALKSLKKLGAPNAIVVDVTLQVRKNNPKWLRSTVKFLEMVAEVWRTARPGICVVTDEPHVRGQLLQELTRRAGKGSEIAAQLNHAGLRLRGLPCATSRQWFMAADATEPLTPQAREILVRFTDSEAAVLISQVDALKTAVASDHSWQDALSDVSRFLSRLASLPSSTRVLVNWLEQAGVPMAVRESYTWPSYRAKLHRLLNAPDFPEKTRLERIMGKCDALWAAYENGTPFARQLADLIEKHTRGTEKCCVVFTKPTAKRLAERYFETYDGYPEGAGFEVLRDCVRMVVSGSLDTELGARGPETLIFAGLDDESIRTLILDDRVSARAHLLLTKRNACYLKSTLRAIDELPEFAAFGTRVKPLLKQLPDFADQGERRPFTREGYVLPTFSFEVGLSAASAEGDHHDPDAWELVLDDGRTIARSPTATVYIHDPSFGYTETRGFSGVPVNSLQEGQRLFVMSAELRELTEASLQDAGIDISHDKQFEASIRQYHTRVLRGIADTLPPGNLSEQARQLRLRILGLPGVKSLPAESSIKNWLNVSSLAAANFDELTSQAPRQAEHFKAFAKAIGFSDMEAVYFWKAVIQPLRGARRADGRRISDAYSDMLMEPESAVVHKRMKPEVVAYLFSRAEDNVYTIEAIKKPAVEEHDV